ncbi:MAG: hypothetical protein RIR00_1124 [Pseudomonadota bacterium]|jgi:NTP pyrophosphatase (non-canonical NTP hydrolase)
MAQGELDDLTRLLLAFRDARNWRQFHTLRSLMVSLNLEAAELLELTQWKSDVEIEALPLQPESREALADECADVLAYLLLVCERAGIDPAMALRRKIEKNGKKYPVAAAWGSSRKYDQLKAEPQTGEPLPEA